MTLQHQTSHGNLGKPMSVAIDHYATPNDTNDQIELQYDPSANGQTSKQSIFGGPPYRTEVFRKQRRPTNYLIPSILACVCCFWPTGCCAIYYANRANEMAYAGDLGNAREMSYTARKLIIASCVIGLVLGIIALILRRYISTT